MPKFNLTDFEGVELQINATNEQEAAKAVAALSNLFKHIDAKTIVQMDNAIKSGSAFDMITIANKLTKKK